VYNTCHPNNFLPILCTLLTLMFIYNKHLIPIYITSVATKLWWSWRMTCSNLGWDTDFGFFVDFLSYFKMSGQCLQLNHSHLHVLLYSLFLPTIQHCSIWFMHSITIQTTSRQQNPFLKKMNWYFSNKLFTQLEYHKQNNTDT